MATAEIDTITGFISPSMHDGELRILDTALAARLGFDRPRKIRELIRRHLPSLEEMGRCPTVGRRPEAGGHAVSEYYLNKKQAIFITAKSETRIATEVTIEIIERFDAYERDAAPHPQIPRTLSEVLPAIRKTGSYNVAPRPRRPSVLRAFNTAMKIEGSTYSSSESRMSNALRPASTTTRRASDSDLSFCAKRNSSIAAAIFAVRFTCFRIGAVTGLGIENSIA